MPFGYRPMAGLPPASSDGDHPEDLILDGQQRITALHYAFSAPDIPLRGVWNPYRFFLDLESVENLEEAEEAVYSARADLGWVKQLEQREIQYEWKTLPFTSCSIGRTGALASQMAFRGGSGSRDDLHKRPASPLE